MTPPKRWFLRKAGQFQEADLIQKSRDAYAARVAEDERSQRQADQAAQQNANNQAAMENMRGDINDISRELQQNQ